jgi:O-antigen/teichoic acid export membrane protein
MLKFGGNNALRLGSNLILTRLLFPEAFGLMALVQVFLTGLQMFSDFGLQASVIRSSPRRGSGFLHTAWTVQILRGACCG